MFIHDIKYVYLYFRINSRRSIGAKLGKVASKIVSKSRIFRRTSEARITELTKKQIKRRSLAKMRWGVNTYNDWHENRLSDSDNYVEEIFNANLNNLATLRKADLSYALCRFLPEITKAKSGDEYPGKTLYELIVSIQRHISENGLNWKLIDGPEFISVKTVLDNIMKERALDNIGTVKRKAEVISVEYENELWRQNVLGEDTPDKLRQTVLFMVGIHCGLRAGDEHYDLRRDAPGKNSQFSFQRNSKGQRCVVYTEDTVTKTNDGGLASLRKERKVVWMYPSSDVTKCPVRLFDKYVSLCPPILSVKQKSNFYLRSMERPNPGQWYTKQVVGQNTLRQTVKEMLKSAKLDGYFTNHSLRRTGTTRLFQAGIDRKLVKEFTGHRSDAVDQYQITSDRQREVISKVIEGANVLEEQKNQNMQSGKSSEIAEANDTNDGCVCKCKNKINPNCNPSDIGNIIDTIVKSGKGGKTVVKFEIEFYNE